MACGTQALCGADIGLLEVFGQTEAMSCYRFWAGQWPEKVAASRGSDDAACALASTLGVDPRAGLKTFKGLPHRLEEVGRKGKVLFVNGEQLFKRGRNQNTLGPEHAETHWLPT